MLIINWKATALKDLEEIIAYIYSRNPLSAMSLEEDIIYTAERLADMPYSGRIGRIAGTRERIFHPNYMIVYQVTDHAINILNILHSKQEYP